MDVDSLIENIADIESRTFSDAWSSESITDSIEQDYNVLFVAFWLDGDIRIKVIMGGPDYDKVNDTHIAIDKDNYVDEEDYIFAGYKPILAHVERFACLYKEYDNMDLLREMGVLFQMNGENFIDGMFSLNKKYCKGLVRDGYIDFISTDTHNDTTRKPNLAEAVEYLYKKIDGEFLDRILYENPEMLFKKID